ncbi:uncharacterized protein LOC120337991 [Styela clava]
MTDEFICEDGNTMIADDIKDVAKRLQASLVEGCGFCNKFKMDSPDSAKKQQHIYAFHCKFSVAHALKDGRKVFCLPCRKSCIQRGITSASRSHYHCPFCKKVYGRRATMELHFMKSCSVSVKPGHSRHPNSRKKGLDPKKVPFSGEKPEMLRQHNELLKITERKLYEWIKHRKSENQAVSITSIRGKARAIFENTKLSLNKNHKKTFQASKLWTEKFLIRYNLSVKERKLSGIGPKSSSSRDALNLSVKSSNDAKRDITMLLIDRVKGRPLLYDPLQNVMQDDDMISNSWQSVAEEVGLESGHAAEAMWKKLEQKYYKNELYTGEWGYEHHLSFLPLQLRSSSDNNNYSTMMIQNALSSSPPMPTEDVDMPSGSQKPIIVTIEETGDEKIGPSANADFERVSRSDHAYASDDRNLYLAELTKIRMKMEFMEKEHKAKMEVLNLKKVILLKKLNNMK